MSRQTLEKKDFTFISGLNTEAGYLTFPENAWVDGDSLIPEIDGSISRRVKLDLENGYTLTPGSSAISDSYKETWAFTFHKWESVGGNGSLSFLVVQHGPFIYFYDASSTTISDNKKSFTINLSSYWTSTSIYIIGTQPISVVSGNGKLLIVATDIDPILITYNSVSDNITVVKQILKIRDFNGVVDGLAVDSQLTYYSNEHYYNLFNQGWDAIKVSLYNNATGLVPSNTQIWTAGKNSTDDFDPATLVKQDFGTTPAPKGRYILNLFNRDRSTVSGIVGITQEIEAQRPAVVGFFAGRVWYAGVESPTIGSWLLFSRIVDTDEKYSQCYQEADPTSEFVSDLISSDGGVIPIPEMGNPIKMVALQDSLIVFASNGIWQISGDALSGFKADGYQVKKLTSFGCSGAETVVEVENTVVFWSNSGIFILGRDQNTGELVPQPLSLNTIQTKYSAINLLSKKYAQGFYNLETKKIIWLYQESPNPDGNTDKYKKNRFLIYDTRLKAFYTYTIGILQSNNPVLIGGILSYAIGNTTTNFSVTEADGDLIIDSSGNFISVTMNTNANFSRIVKYLTLVPSGGEWQITFSDFENLENAPYKFKDWYTLDTTGIESSPLPYLITGYYLADSGSHILQAPYITTIMKRTETGVDSNGDPINPSGALLQGRWEWTDNSAANRWSSSEQVYRHRNMWTPTTVPSATYVDGYPVVVAKSKIRGKGRALNLKYTCESGKDMQLVGWSIVYNKNANV